VTARRCVRRVAVHPRVLVDLMTHGTDGIDVVDHPLPAGARYVLCTWDPLGATVWIIVEHESFDPIAEGEVIPEHEAPVFRRRERVSA
jgi:hypothetical protein